MTRRFALLTILVLAAVGGITAKDRAGNVTILTQNMDAGTDQNYIVAALGPNPPFALDYAVALTAQELEASQIELRARALAAKIAETTPDLVALQEATRWEISTPAATVVYDQLDFLLSELATLNMPYEIVALNNVNDITLGPLHFSDRDVLLVRSDLGPPELHFSNVHSHLFNAGFSFAGLPISAGWISADVHMANRHFRLVTTHLTSPIPDFPDAMAAQIAQGNELIHALRNTQIPVVICGDFNSDANHGMFVDATPTADNIAAAGYEEVWPLTHETNDPGLTWPYYLEDQFPPPIVVPFAPLERIDLFFERGMQPISAELVIVPTGTTPPDASDHAGVLAVLHP